MKKQEIIDRLKEGAEIRKSSYMKFKRNKIVRGSFYEYWLGYTRITSTQFDSLHYLLKVKQIDLNNSDYILNETVEIKR